MNKELPPPPSVMRHMSPGLEAALQQFADPEVLAAGKVNVIALDAVLERFGARWPMRREQVHEHVDATLHRQLGSQGYHLRISDTDILVCQPHLDRLWGQAFCIRVLREILGHFLGGDAQLADIGVHEVLSASAEGVEARRVDARAAFEAAANGDSGGPPPAPPEPGTIVGNVDIWTPFIAANGRQIEVACVLTPIVELKGGTTIGLRLGRRVTDGSTGLPFSAADLARLSRADRLRIDLGVIVQGLNLLREQPPGSQPLTLIIPVSFSSLPNLDARARMVSAFQEARRYARQGVICELCEIDGVPPATLSAAAALIRPFCLFVLGHISELTRTEARAMREAGLRAVSIVCPPHEGEAVFLGWAKAATALAKQAANGVIVYGLSSERQRRVVQAVGATHAGLAAA